MLKVFIVEDESLVREGIRDNVSWEENGFEFVGEAGDGEMALPLIRKTKPDLLITDIKMPFMDGLELSRIVSAEFPEMKIVILSGHDDFEFAREAISLSVEQYLLKPITKAALNETLVTIKEKFEKENEQKVYSDLYLKELQEYEQYERRVFFESLTAGTMKASEIFEEAKKLNIGIEAGYYNMVLFVLQPGNYTSGYSDNSAKLQEEVISLFLAEEKYLLFRQNMMTYALLIKGEENNIEELTSECVDRIAEKCKETGADLEWYVAKGQPVERLSSISKCFMDANHLLSLRFIYPDQHILDSVASNKDVQGELENTIDQVDVDKIDPMIIRNFLQTGLASEVEDFVKNYMDNMGAAMNSLLFLQYVLLSIRFNAAIVAKSFGSDQEEFLKSIPEIGSDMGAEATSSYIRQVLGKVIEIREAESQNRSDSILKKALSYIDENFADSEMSLNRVARQVNVSANYFSAVFSQEMGQTFIEYLTSKRMEKAKQLLRQTSMRSGEIAANVGYQDPRYFSFLFRKTVGCTPRDYRG